MYDDPIYDAIYLARNGYASGGSTLLDKLGQTWPARLAQSTWDAIKAPHDVYTGKLPMYTADENGEVSLNSDVIQRTTDIAGLAALGGSGAYPVAKSAGYAPNALQFGTAGGGYSKAIPKHLQEGIDAITPNNPRGLPMDYESRMLRAKEMGFDVDTPVYHGTNADFDAFDQSLAKSSSHANPSDLGTWFVGDPEYAKHHGDKLIEAYLAMKNPKEYERTLWDNINKNNDFKSLRSNLESSGYDGVLINEGREMLGRHEVVNPSMQVAFQPNQIRSVHATFDPQRKDSSNLMASLAALIGSGALADYYNQGQ